MREYQLAGLRWLVDRWDDGVNTILGDEMVCYAFGMFASQAEAAHTLRHTGLWGLTLPSLRAKAQGWTIFTYTADHVLQLRMLHMSAGPGQDAADGGVPVVPEERAGRARAVPGRRAAVRAQQLVRCQSSGPTS